MEQHKTGTKNIVLFIAIWMVAKSVLNLVLGFRMDNIISLVVMGALGYLLLKRIKYANYIVAVFLTAVVLQHLVDNIVNFRILYLAEAAVDILASYLLVFNKNVKNFF